MQYMLNSRVFRASYGLRTREDEWSSGHQSTRQKQSDNWATKFWVRVRVTVGFGNYFCHPVYCYPVDFSPSCCVAQVTADSHEL